MYGLTLVLLTGPEILFLILDVPYEPALDRPQRLTSAGDSKLWPGAEWDSLLKYISLIDIYLLNINDIQDIFKRNCANYITLSKPKTRKEFVGYFHPNMKKGIY